MLRYFTSIIVLKRTFELCGVTRTYRVQFVPKINFLIRQLRLQTVFICGVKPDVKTITDFFSKKTWCKRCLKFWESLLMTDSFFRGQKKVLNLGIYHIIVHGITIKTISEPLKTVRKNVWIFRVLQLYNDIRERKCVPQKFWFHH